MKKKFRRGERKEIIRRLNHFQILASDLGARLSETEARKKEAERRLMVAGTEIETLEEAEGPVQIIRVEPKVYGNYMCAALDATEEEVEQIKEELAKGIARGLVEQNIVQFICRGQSSFDPLSRFGTVGAKLFVIPWEEMRTRKLEILKQLK